MIQKVSDDEPGYRSVEANEDLLLHSPMVAFVKWEAVPGGEELLPHWHLSPDSPAVRDKVEFLLREPVKDPHTEVEVVPP